jgi:outer membrane protein assembly factor BamB
MKIYYFAILILLVSCGKKQEIAQWRGVNRDGVYHEKNLLKTWPDEGPELLWAYEETGDGYGSVSVLNERIYVSGVIDSLCYLNVLDLNGQLVWKAPNGPGFVGEGFSGSYPGSHSTPTVINDLVYVSSGLGRIACFEIKTGKEVWAVNMLTDLNGRMDYFGYAESLLIEGDKLFCYPGGIDTNIVALNRFSGETIWVSKAMSDSVTHCSPIVITLPGRKVLVTFSVRNLLGLDAETGELLWVHEQEKRKYSEQSNTPVFYNDHLYYVAGDGNGAVKLKIADNGNSFKELWRNYFGRNSQYNFLIKNDILYSSTDKYSLKALNIHSGEVVDSLRVKNGTLITADDMLYCYSDNGNMNLIDITSDKMELVSTFKIEKGTKEHFSTPTISNGAMYLRRGKALMAYKLQE